MRERVNGKANHRGGGSDMTEQRRGRSVLWIAIVALSLVVSACGGGTAATQSAAPATATTAPATAAPATSEPSEATGGKDIVIGLSLNSRASAIFVALAEYLKRYSADYGKQIGRDISVVETVADDDPTRQNADINDLISKGVDLIVAVSIDDTAIGAGIEAAKAAGIPFITYGRPVADGVTEPDAHVGIDAVDQAYTAGLEIAKVVSAAGTTATCIEVQGDLRDVNAKRRTDGWAQAVSESNGVLKTAATLPAEWSADKALSLLSTALTANASANCVFLASDFYLDAAKGALEPLGKWAPRGQAGHTFLASQDVFPGGVTALEQGYIDIDVNFPVFEQIVATVQTGVKLVDRQPITDAERMNLVKGGVLTPDNIKTTENLWGRDFPG